MNNETILKCATLAAQQQQAFLGRVDLDIQDLIAELIQVEQVPQKAPAAVEQVPEQPAEA